MEDRWTRTSAFLERFSEVAFSRSPTFGSCATRSAIGFRVETGANRRRRRSDRMFRCRSHPPWRAQFLFDRNSQEHQGHYQTLSAGIRERGPVDLRNGELSGAAVLVPQAQLVRYELEDR